MNDQPPALAGIVILQDPLGRQQFTGTTFALWRDDFAVTAGHVLALKLPDPRWHWRVAWHGLASRPVLSIERHESADLAVMRLADGPPWSGQPFDLGPLPAANTECAIFGHAWDLVPPDAGSPGSEIRKGPFLPPEGTRGPQLKGVHAQPGFSGAPVFATDKPNVAIGLTFGGGNGRGLSLVPGGPMVGIETDALVVSLADHARWLAAVTPADRGS